MENQDPAQLLAAQEQLESARRKLKKIFVGIDAQIDQMIDASLSWYLLPELQERPVVINLWGMTGTGKSDLIRTFVKLIDKENFYYPFDLSAGGNHWQMERTLRDYHQAHRGKPCVLVFDEFQHARTIDEDGRESNRQHLLWKLLDSGTYRIMGAEDAVYDVLRLTRDLRYCIRKGVKAQKGEIIEGEEIHHKVFDEPYFHPDLEQSEQRTPLVPGNFFKDIYQVDHARHQHKQAVGDFLATLNERQTLTYLKNIVEKGARPLEVDCSRALVFVVGNLDEVYTMAANFSVDREADFFHRQSLKIDILDVKRELQKRFRFEQIARLGNTHLIYPALSRRHYEEIIELRLQDFADKFASRHGVKLRFEASLKDLLYREGVYPTQGVRPLLTTLQCLVYDKLSLLLVEKIKKQLPANCAHLAYADGRIVAPLYQDENLLETVQIPLQLPLERKRRVPKDDEQAVTAVHEAGHAVVYLYLLGIVPDLIKTATLHKGESGFTSSLQEKKFYARDEVLSYLAIYLSGLEAERIVFGHQRVTSGSEGDLKKATQMAAHFFQKSGLGRKTGSYAPPGSIIDTGLSSLKETFEAEIENALEQASELAQNCLQKEERLLLQLARYLSEHPQMNKSEIRQMAEQFGSESLPLQKPFYRRRLLERFQAREAIETNGQAVLNNFILNKKS
mgnify:CR=1 FL=1